MTVVAALSPMILTGINSIIRDTLKEISGLGRMTGDSTILRFKTIKTNGSII